MDCWCESRVLRSFTMGIRSIIGLAERPGMEVEPMCSTVCRLSLRADFSWSAI